MRFGGANQKEMWLGNAQGGMGVNASVTSENDFDPVPDFEPVGSKSTTVTFKAENDDGDPINARIYVGHYEARASPIADTNPTTTGPINLDDTAKFAQAKYEFVAHAPGYGHVRFGLDLRSKHKHKSKTRTVEIEFLTNWASATSGATVTTPNVGATVAGLIDDTESTQWTANADNFTGTPTPGSPGGALSVDGKQATVDLAGSKAIRVRYVQVSAHIGPNSGRFAPVRQFELWACDSHTSNCATDAGFSKVYTSSIDAFPGDPPRPVAPHLILRKFDTPDFKATHVRFVVKHNQCTGGAGFQGDQDADPNNNPDCDSNVPGNSARNFVRTAELQVFSRSPDIDD